MPNRDGTGPEGKGPETGRGLGLKPQVRPFRPRLNQRLRPKRKR